MCLRDELQRLAEHHRLVALYAFGSRAEEAGHRLRGEPVTSVRPDADLDVGVLPRRGGRLSVRARVDLATALEDLFQVPRVDLVVLPETPPFLALEVVRGELLACTDADEEARTQLHVLARAGDLAPYEAERVRAVLEEGAR
ncbi:MAG: nucleotidyltransferase domain-containing protein [Deferrisomatales bacterium]